MATQGRRPQRRPQKTTKPPQQKRRPGQPKHATKPPQAKKVVFDAAVAQNDEPRTFRLGVVPGATPGKWIDAWKLRMPHVALEVVPVAVSDQDAAIDDLDAALVRLPLGADTLDALHVISLYDEVPVVVASIESHLLAADDLHLADLAGEVLIALTDDTLPALDAPGALAPRFAPLSTPDAIATAATGAGAVVVPMSLARLHHRKDADYRPLVDGPTSTVALAWARERTTPDVETFVGIVRGRTAHSSR
ncbi:LysR substrate-binding domain-containing protein [Microbacterium sp. NPDC090225]|uniref:LysR substrate-binding domain-containing protein n=1 Tax=Microbacterium sp. NPDC090225 TaxID=3364207 RepID=UPI00381D0A76